MATLRQVLSGSGVLAAGSNTLNVTLTTPLLDLEKAFLLASYEPSADEPQNGEISYQITALNQIRFQRNTGSGAPAINVSWYVVEFVSGVTVQRGTILPSASPTTVAIAAVNLSKTFILSSSRRSGSAFEGRDFVELDLPNSTTLQARIGTGSSITVEYQIVEYDNCTVQSGRVSSWSGTSITATISSVNLSKSLLFFSYLSSGGTTANIGQKLVTGELTDVTTLTFQRHNTGSTISISWFLVEFSDAVAVQRGVSTFGAADLTQNSILTTIDPARAIAFLGGWNGAHGRSPYSLNDHPGIAAFSSSLSANQLTLTRGFTASDTVGATATWQVAEFPTATGGVNLSGAIAATSTITGALAVGKPLSGIIGASSTVTGALAAGKPLSGVIAASSGITGNLTVGSTLQGAVAASSTITGNLSVGRLLSAVIAASSSITGNLTVGNPESEFESLLPPSIKDARFLAAEQVFYRITELNLAPLNIYDFDQVEASALPHLAEQFNVTGYRGWLLADTEQKRRNLLKAAIELHRYAGTPWAIKNALTTLGYGDVTIEENPGARFDGEYSFDGSIRFTGKLYATFRVNLNIGGRSLPPVEIDLIIKLINEWKNARSHLIEVIFTNFARYDGQIYFDGVYNFGGQPI